jgi:hypothetical protein
VLKQIRLAAASPTCRKPLCHFGGAPLLLPDPGFVPVDPGLFPGVVFGGFVFDGGVVPGPAFGVVLPGALLGFGACGVVLGLGVLPGVVLFGGGVLAPGDAVPGAGEAVPGAGEAVPGAGDALPGVPPLPGAV